jgi:2-methylcitrate dehydratase PrpD
MGVAPIMTLSGAANASSSLVQRFGINKRKASGTASLAGVCAALRAREQFVGSDVTNLTRLLSLA